MSERWLTRIINALLIPVLAVISGLALASVFILFTTTPPLVAYRELFKSGFGCEELTRCGLFQTLQLATPLMLTGLSTVMAFRSGMFSIGQEGQYLIGATMAAWLGFAVHLPPVIHPAFIIAASMLAAGIYGWIPEIGRA